MRALRHNLDQYETADWQVDALVDHLPELSGSIWCPTVGDGALARQLLLRRPDLTLTLTNDLDPALIADCHLDATKLESWSEFGKVTTRPDWVVENPPFNVAIDVLKHAYVRARRGVALLLRITFTEPTRDRSLWLANHPIDLQVTLERYSFTGNGKSDNVTAAWFVWAKPEMVPIENRGVYVSSGYKPEMSRKRVTITS